MSIKADVDELQHINADIRRSLESLKSLRGAKKDVETRIASFLREKDLPGVKYNQNVIVLRQKSTNRSQPKKIRTGKIIDLLSQSGVTDPQALLKRINEIGKDKVTHDMIKIDKRI